MRLQAIADCREDFQPGEILVVGLDQRPRRLTRAGSLDHVVDGLLIRVPLLSIPPVLVGQLPAFVDRMLARAETLELFALRNVNPVLDEDDSMSDELGLELVDLGVRARPLLW